MNRHLWNRPTVLASLCLLLTMMSETRSDVIRIPQQVQSIQAAVLRAGDRDTILVAAGTYYANLNYLGKQLVVKSESGPAVTTLMPADMHAPLFTFVNFETGNARLDGFTITGYDVGAVTEPVVIFNMNKLASPVIQNCIVRDNHGITVARIMDDGPRFVRCVFYNNSGGPVMQVLGGVVSFLNCTIDRCENGIYAYNADVEVRNSSITNCTGYAVRGYVGLFDYNNVWNNGLPSDSGARTGLHDISADPMFVDAPSGNYNLRPGSPCIDTGDPNSFLNDPDGSRGDIGARFYLGPTGVDDEAKIPFGYSLSQNYPNPFNPSTSIVFSLPHRTQARVEIMNILGERVKTLVDELLPAGEQVIEWNGHTDTGTPVASGVYFYRLVTDEFSAVRPMVLLK